MVRHSSRAGVRGGCQQLIRYLVSRELNSENVGHGGRPTQDLGILRRRRGAAAGPPPKGWRCRAGFKKSKKDYLSGFYLFPYRLGFLPFHRQLDRRVQAP